MINKLHLAMIELYRGDAKRIQHFCKVETLQKVEVVLDIQFSAVNCKNLLLHRLILFAL